MRMKQVRQIMAAVLSIILLLMPGVSAADSNDGEVFFLPDDRNSAYYEGDTSFNEALYCVQEDNFSYSGTLETDFIAPRVEAEEESGLLKASELPEKYNAMDDGYITPIKDQLSGTQTCWAFQYTQCMESDLLHDGNLDTELAPLGTAFFQYYLPADPLGLVGENTANKLTLPSIANYYMVGGNSIYTMMSQSGWIGLTEEENLPYSEENLQKDDYNYADYTFDYIQTGAYIYNKADISLIKQQILEHGSAGIDLNSYIFSSYYGTAHFRFSHEEEGKLDFYAFCTPSDALQGTNHSMQIIGWDDTISKKKFRNVNGTCPENDGGWLVRNTSGSSWPASMLPAGSPEIKNAGCVWVSYEDSTIGKNIYFFDAEPVSNYLHNYHYDQNASSHKTTAKSAACLYQAVETEKLTHINVGFADASVEYTVEIYLSSEKPDTPTSGTLVHSQKENRTESAGLYTVELSNPVLLHKGQWFSIVIRTDRDTSFYTEAEQRVSRSIWGLRIILIHMIPDLKESEGWLSMDGETFVDASADEYLCCPRIKGFTQAYEAPKPVEDDTPEIKETYSKNWFMTDGVWKVLGKNGEIVKNSWVCDNAVIANGLNVWYFMDREGNLLDAELACDSSGNFYSFENQHNGYYGSMRIRDGVYTIAGQQIYLQFSHVHDGTYGRIINTEAIAFLKQLQGVNTPVIPTESELVYTAFM